MKYLVAIQGAYKNSFFNFNISISCYCIITDTDNKDIALIYTNTKPMEGSSITFRNCTIDKPTGALLEGYNATGWKLDLIFENTPISDNLQIVILEEGFII